MWYHLDNTDAKILVNAHFHLTAIIYKSSINLYLTISDFMNVNTVYERHG